MKRALLLVLILAVSACGASEEPATPAASQTPAASPTPQVRPAPGTHQLSVNSGGQRRTFLLHAPPGYQPGQRLPLVVALHFFPGDGTGMQQLTGLDALADKENFLVAYPDGLNAGFNALICCGTEDDVAFVTAVVEHARTTWNADPERVYATGISNGADMSFKLAVEASETFAAVGVISGGFAGPNAAKPDYRPTTPVSVLTIVGRNDMYFDAFQEGLATWREKLKCTEGAKQAKPLYTHTVARCGDGSVLEAYLMSDMGHSWPGAPKGQLADPDAGLTATEVIWRFFEAHHR
ncbi:polyhydroxybutyrate depolymerase [Actinoplanes sp. TBRC 11911]|uniref:extracellular catalytic domain type 1 short-chain-length polyhydroxyalkanoate depolymerase n=1 Tax=Actinoplanes sp. TBRC 11911 TaxID=2729386 RepID=UPI0018144608|nr:PHB depolymerase family esterase [Actinoplanes sp. TBRC 11911]NMO49810.1 polyhydroxybutyrate depolymerase [Actinoplanes sp. TBRC 11911]